MSISPRRQAVQRSPPGSTQKICPSFQNAPLMKPAPTCPPIRRSARAKSALVYDQKYHPLDDIIRPSQAAKRRTLHGEQPLLESRSKGGGSDESVSDVWRMAYDDDSDDEGLQPAQSRKRKRVKPLTPEPTRRSSRRRSKPKTSYDMNIHPQDSDLKRIWACNGSKSSPLPAKQTNSIRAITSVKKTPCDEFDKVCRGLLEEDDSEGMRSRQARQRIPVDPANSVQTRLDQHQKFRSCCPVTRLHQSPMLSMSICPSGHIKP